MITDTDRINWLIDNKADIEAPDENNTWVIYNKTTKLGYGLGCDKDLRIAIDDAMENASKGQKKI